MHGCNIEKSKWMREDLAADAFDNQIKVIGIAFTEAADFQLIQSISQQTSGKYFRVLAAEDLQNVLHDLEHGEIYDAMKYLGDIITELRRSK